MFIKAITRQNKLQKKSPEQIRGINVGNFKNSRWRERSSFL